MRTKLAVLTLSLVGIGTLLSGMACSSKKSPTSSTPASTSRSTTASTPPRAGATSRLKTSAPAAQGIDPCGLINLNDAASALGEAVDAAKRSAARTIPAVPGVSVTAQNCSYDSTTTAHSVSLDLWSVAAADADKLKQGIDQIVCASKEKIAGLGDVACWYSTTHDELQVAKGGAFVDLTISNGGKAADQPLMSLAQSALGRLA